MLNVLTAYMVYLLAYDRFRIRTAAAATSVSNGAPARVFAKGSRIAHWLLLSSRQQKSTLFVFGIWNGTSVTAFILLFVYRLGMAKTSATLPSRLILRRNMILRRPLREWWGYSSVSLACFFTRATSPPLRQSYRGSVGHNSCR